MPNLGLNLRTTQVEIENSVYKNLCEIKNFENHQKIRDLCQGKCYICNMSKFPYLVGEGLCGIYENVQWA